MLQRVATLTNSCEIGWLTKTSGSVASADMCTPNRAGMPQGQLIAATESTAETAVRPMIAPAECASISGPADEAAPEIGLGHQRLVRQEFLGRGEPRCILIGQ